MDYALDYAADPDVILVVEISAVISSMTKLEYENESGVVVTSCIT